MNIKATYKDEIGFINSTLVLENGKYILDIDGAKFISEDLSGFQRFNNEKTNRIIVDEFNRILNCKLIFYFPIIILKNSIETKTFLEIELQIGGNTEPKNWKITKQKIILDEFSIYSNSTIIDLEKLKNNLPNNVNLKCCFDCQYSDLGIYSNPFFGFMIFFKNFKTEYLKVNQKDDDYIKLLDNVSEDDFVYETYVCSEFKIRKPNTGYRG